MACPGPKGPCSMGAAALPAATLVGGLLWGPHLWVRGQTVVPPSTGSQQGILGMLLPSLGFHLLIWEAEVATRLWPGCLLFQGGREGAPSHTESDLRCRCSAVAAVTSQRRDRNAGRPQDMGQPLMGWGPRPGQSRWQVRST